MRRDECGSSSRQFTRHFTNVSYQIIFIPIMSHRVTLIHDIHIFIHIFIHVPH
jgi:hypothetical protein